MFNILNYAANLIAQRNMDDILNGIKAKFERQENEIKKLRDKIDHYNKDEEIQKLKEEIEKIKVNSLFNLTDVEKKRDLAFKQKHTEMHDQDCSGFMYRIDYDAIGSFLTIKCPVCGEEEDITDYGSI